MLLGGAVLVVGLTSVCLIYSGLLTLPLAVVVELLVRRDTYGMATGRMDPRGRAQAETARRLAWGGVAAGFLGGLFCAGPLWETVMKFAH
jgi:hypothetical protein